MRKSDELQNPDSCLNRALPDELIFTLLDRDRAMPNTLRFWATERARLGLNAPDDQQVAEARELANTVEAMQAAR